MPAKASVIGASYGRFVVLRDSERLGPRGQRYVFARCECGSERELRLCSLTTGNTKSCGCLKVAVATAMGKRNASHGNASRSGASVEYNAWQAMLKRCYNPTSHNFKYYGARGITVDERWRASFEVFLSDVGRRPGIGYSLDRKDNDGNYEPGNVRWATASEQNSNKRWRAA